MVLLDTLLQPRASVTVRVTVYVPLAVKVRLGFCVVAVVPSPKFQRYVELVVGSVFVKL